MKIDFENDQQLSIEHTAGGRYPITISFGEHETSLSVDEIKELMQVLLEAL